MTNTEILNRIGSTVTEAGKEGLEKAKELRDTAVISLEIRDREASIRKAYRELGKAYFQDHKSDADPVYDQIVYIKAAFEEIGELKTAKDDIRGIRRCPACGEPIQDGANFCPICGKRYEKTAEDSMREEAAAEPENKEAASEAEKPKKKGSQKKEPAKEEAKKSAEKETEDEKEE